MNVFVDDWDDAYPQIEGWRSNYKRLGVGNLGLGLYELLPGQTQCPYHFHHGNDEALVVLAGHPTLRAPESKAPPISMPWSRLTGRAFSVFSWLRSATANQRKT